ncbi:aldo/keto reductase [Spirillospora sp. NBC_00431]
MPNVELIDGAAMPQVGFGVFQVPDDGAERAVTAALEAGYRSVDTASAYRNEEGVGRALRGSGLPREDLFVTSKLGNDEHGYDSALRACDASLARLGLRARSIGVSNFTVRTLRRIIGEADVVPAVNQIELHPYFQRLRAGPGRPEGDRGAGQGHPGRPRPRDLRGVLTGKGPPPAASRRGTRSCHGKSWSITFCAWGMIKGAGRGPAVCG